MNAPSIPAHRARELGAANQTACESWACESWAILTGTRLHERPTPAAPSSNPARERPFTCPTPTPPRRCRWCYRNPRLRPYVVHFDSPARSEAKSLRDASKHALRAPSQHLEPVYCAFPAANHGERLASASARHAECWPAFFRSQGKRRLAPCPIPLRPPIVYTVCAGNFRCRLQHHVHCDIVAWACFLRLYPTLSTVLPDSHPTRSRLGANHTHPRISLFNLLAAHTFEKTLAHLPRGSIQQYHIFWSGRDCAPSVAWFLALPTIPGYTRCGLGRGQSAVLICCARKGVSKHETRSALGQLP